MVKVSDPRVTARHLIVKAKAVRAEIEEVEESIRLLADGDAEIAKLESELAARVAGSSLVSLRANVLGTQSEIEALEKAIGSLEDALAAASRLHASLAEEGRAATWNAFRAEAEAKLKQARISYLRSRNPRAVPFVEEINAAIEALRQLLKP
jgi:DNA repair exonuclease SbcCD ATPase subunit